VFILKVLKLMFEQMDHFLQACSSVFLKAPICVLWHIIYCHENKGIFDHPWLEVCYNMLVTRLYSSFPYSTKHVRYTKYMYKG